MPKSLLAVDDSVTMRKVFQMTFAGEDIQLTAVATAQEAIAACRKQRPDVVLADLSLDGLGGYDLCRAIKDEMRGVPVVLLSSKQTPYDPARGQAAGADEHMDKPYDTTKLIELVRRLFTQPEAVAPAAVAARPAAAPAPQAAVAAQRPAAAAPPANVSAARPATGVGRPVAPEVRAPSERPIARDAGDIQHGTLAELAQVQYSGGNGAPALSHELSSKLDGLGLTSAQIDAVVALSREVVERVVWEVVPLLAETMVKEEIARLTRDA